MLQHLAGGARQRHAHAHGHGHGHGRCGVGANREECERVHGDASIPPLFRRTPELAHWYDQRRQRFARLHALRSTPHMGRLAVTALYAWMGLCYFALLRTVLAPLLAASAWWVPPPAVLGAVFAGFTGLLALTLALHALLLRSSPGLVPTSWVPPVTGLRTQQQQMMMAATTKPTGEEVEEEFTGRGQPGVEVVVLQAPPLFGVDALAGAQGAHQHQGLGGSDVHDGAHDGEEDHEEADDDALQGSDDEDDRRWRDYCVKCNSLRPPRARHCRVCDRCVLKMDHHCPWVNNCVGNNNFKLFYIFLCTASLLGVSASSLFLLGGLHFWRQWDDMAQDAFWREGALLFGNWWLSLAATAHIAMMTGHMYVNLTENATTIEQIALGPRRRSSRRQGRAWASNRYDLGREENMRQVLGDGGWRRWLHPLSPPATDGFSFPTRP